MFSDFIKQEKLTESLKDLKAPKALVDFIFNETKNQFAIRMLESILKQKQTILKQERLQENILKYNKLIEETEMLSEGVSKLDKMLVHIDTSLLDDLNESLDHKKDEIVKELTQKPLVVNFNSYNPKFINVDTNTSDNLEDTFNRLQDNFQREVDRILKIAIDKVT